MKQILHITYDMGIGGTEQVINQIVRGTNPKAICHRICCIEGSVGAIGQALQQQGTSIDLLRRQPGFDVGLIRGIRRLIRQHKIDVVHCHQYTPWVYGWFAALATGVKVIFTEHGRFFPDCYRHKAWLINKLMAATTDRMTAISQATKAALVEYEFLPENRIEVIYNGIQALVSTQEGQDRARLELGIQPDQRVIGTVARLDEIKNQCLMLDTFAQLASQYPDLVLLLVGDGPERDNLLQQAQQLDITDRVIFAGFKSPATDYMALMELFLLPSLSEGTSMTLLEAMSLGIPCIVSNAGGNPEVIRSPVVGSVFDLARPAELGDVIVHWLQRTQNRKDKEQRQQHFNQYFSADSMNQRFSELYGVQTGRPER